MKQTIKNLKEEFNIKTLVAIRQSALGYCFTNKNNIKITISDDLELAKILFKREFGNFNYKIYLKSDKVILMG